MPTMPLRCANKLERELRDAETEARTFARVIDAAVCVVMDAREQSDAVEAVRALVGTFFAADDLPPILRTTGPATPAPRPTTGRGRTAQGRVERTSRTSA
ncbi:MAG: hypothetical protein K0S65_4299 [Labilithrix sp.]|nr:hypothetical protein [Labilithrix sp.]